MQTKAEKIAAICAKCVKKNSCASRLFSLEINVVNCFEALPQVNVVRVWEVLEPANKLKA